MKTLNVKLETIADLMQKKSLDSNFVSSIQETVDFEEISEPELINEDWVKIKVKLGGICGSDLHVLELNTSLSQSVFVSFPLILGHEIVGNVIEVGENVKGFSAGDNVIVEPLLHCKIRGVEPCQFCDNDNYHVCSNLDLGVLAPGQFIGSCKDTGGGWGEYIVAHESQIFKMPDSIPFETAVLTEPFSVAIHAVFKKLPEDSDIVVVVGCGTIGLTTIAALKSFSKCKVIATAKYPFQADLARQLGADEVVMVKKDRHLKKIGKELGCRILAPLMDDAYPVGSGADIVFDSVGNASSISDSLRLVKPRGTVVLIGMPAVQTVDLSPMVIKEIEVIPSYTYSYEDFEGEKKRTFQIAIDLLAEKKVDLSMLLTHKFTIDQYKSALSVASDKQHHDAIKVAFEYK